MAMPNGILGGEMGRERQSAKRPAFHKPLRCRPPCAQRQANGYANGIPWVRARGAHCKTVCTQSNCRPFDMPIGLSRPSKAPRHWIAKGHAIGSRASSFAVRALCAHQRNGNASHKALALHKGRRWRNGPRKAKREALHLSQAMAVPTARRRPPCLLSSLPLYSPPWEDYRNSTTARHSSTW